MNPSVSEFRLDLDFGLDEAQAFMLILHKILNDIELEELEVKFLAQLEAKIEATGFSISEMFED